MHDTALATGKHRTAEGLGTQQVAREVDRQHLVPLLQAQPVQRTGAQHAGVVDQYIAAPMQRLNLGGGPLHAGRVGDVAAQGADLTDAVFTQGGSQFTAFVQVTVQQDHMGVLPDQGAGQRRANTTGGTGDHADGRVQAQPLRGDLVVVHAALQSVASSGSQPRAGRHTGRMDKTCNQPHIPDNFRPAA
ncbi:hypothetical protein D3C76_919090 [compost metagenome]